MTPDPRLLRLAVWGYHRVLRLYPKTFRADYGGSMVQAFRDRCRAAHKTHGLGGLLRVGAAGLLDAAANGVLERTSGTADLSAARAVGPAVAHAPRVSHASDAFLREMRLAARRLIREPTFTIVVVLTLALGIGAATTIFSVVHGVLLQPLPYRDASRVVTLWQWNQPKGIDEEPSPANFLDWRDRVRTLDLAAAEPFGVDLTGSGDRVRLDTWRVSERFFDVLGVAPALGRTFLPEEHQSGRHYVALLSDRLWRTRYGSDPAIVGRTITLDGKAVLVAGVLPARVDYPGNKDIWIPRVFSDRDRQAPRADLLSGDRAAEAGGHARAGARGHAGHRRAAGHRVSAGEGPGAPPAAASARGGRMRAVHRVRERRQPHAGPRGRPPRGDCGQARARRRTPAAPAADARGRSAAVAGGSRSRRAVVLLGRRRHRRARPA
jgi:hypothetical protein